MVARLKIADAHADALRSVRANEHMNNEHTREPTPPLSAMIAERNRMCEIRYMDGRMDGWLRIDLR